MSSKFVICSLLSTVCSVGSVQAEAQDETPAAPSAAPAVPPAPAASASASAAAAPAKSEWDGVIGLTGAYRPRYPGAPKQALRVTPGFYLRYGRYTITNASGFAPRRAEDVVRGLGVDMLRGDRLAVSLSLRYDNGRSEHGSEAYAGLGNIPHTVRARVAASYDLSGGWRIGAAWNADALGRGTGGVGDISAGWEKHLSRLTTLSLSSSLSMGDAHYMQAYYGITPAQSGRSIYPVYAAGAGWRDIGLGASLRHDFAGDWVALASVGATRLLGSAAGSPITRSRNGWSLGSGLGWRF